ncbi:hypothetical protein LOK49_LG06G01410 [Camellia lanceoleosa]|uniref:Uncharacterized protein n=1 Tax=Camellia lanceoleosa TaxID=1840588 RepID=A0ACC0HCF8_9ERIC|nr:hypothetical protein LOK49_LG06G01410 [Camellia lanceoleosa]
MEKAMADFGDDEYKHMLCMETAEVEKAITLKPGEKWRGRQERSVVPSSYCSGQLDPQRVYEHRIYRYLESPSEPLPSTKDDEHILAYRLPKRAELTRLEICHRYLENGKENGFAMEAIDELANIYATHSGPGNQSMDSLELEEMSYKELTFQLCIIDNRGLNCRPISKDSLIKTGQLVKVMLY